MKTRILWMLMLCTGCPSGGEVDAQKACYELADVNCSWRESCGSDKYACLAGYIDALPCHDAVEVMDVEDFETCVEATPDLACDEEKPAACSGLIRVR